jgi:tetratricopeptide (TPR) repeat protein
MIPDWFNAREAVDAGATLADSFAPAGARGSRTGGKDSAPDLEGFLRNAARHLRPLKLNLFKRAKLLDTFKSRLLERGVDRGRVEELTRLLLLQISGARGGGAIRAPGPAGVQAAGNARKRIPALLGEAEALMGSRKYAGALERLEEILKIEPDHPLAHNALGDALCHLGRFHAAEMAFRRAIELRPAMTEALFNLGTVLRWRGEFAAAETVLRRAVKQDPRSTEALTGLGHTLSALDRAKEAKECFEKALRLKPRHAGALCGLGWLASMDGRFEESERWLRTALDADPKCSEAWAWRVELRRMTGEDRDWLEGAERMLAEGVPPVEEARLRFALGKYFNDIGSYSRAFEQYKRANELQKLHATPYDRPARAEFVDEMIRLYPRERLARAVEGASGSERPVFVVGMMRSGTSLVEQIIASHPLAAGAGELEYWNTTALKYREVLRPGTPEPELLSRMTGGYLKILGRQSSGAQRVVDKSTYNSDHLGIIHLAFPKARILYLRRDPLDVCLSCFFQQFSTAANFTLDLSDLAHFYREHHRLIAHWRSVLPQDAFLEVPYAELVADQEGWSRRIIEFLGLPWDPKVLEFHKTERSVPTASHWQVRQKIYSSSVGRWKHYEKFIGPLLPLRKLG